MKTITHFPMNLFPLFDPAGHFTTILLNRSNGESAYYQFAYKKISAIGGLPSVSSDCPVTAAENILAIISNTICTTTIHNQRLLGEELNPSNVSNKVREWPVLTCELDEEKNIVKIYFTEHPSLWVMVPVREPSVTPNQVNEYLSKF